MMQPIQASDILWASLNQAHLEEPASHLCDLYIYILLFFQFDVLNSFTVQST